MFERFQHRGWHYGILLAAGACLFLVNLGGATLWDLDEGRNATCALEMLDSGNYIVPTFNADLRVDKPALLYWLQVAAYRQFGVNEFSARLPSALAALLTMLLCYELGRSMFGQTTGLLGGLVVGATPMLCGAGRFANPDALLNLCVVLTMLFFWIGQHRPTGWWYASLGFAAGLAVLAKGPVGLVLPTGVLVFFSLWTGQLRLFLRPAVLWSWLAFLLTAVPWYAWVGAETKGKFLEGFLLNHNVSRALAPMEAHGGSPFYYVVVLLLGTAPWSIFAGLVFWHGIGSTRRYTQADLWAGRRDQPAAYRFLLVWFGLFFVFFSLVATKLPNYILPVSVPFALLTARFLVGWCQHEIQPPWWTLYVSLGFLLLVGIGTGVALTIAGGVWPLPLLRGQKYPGLEQGALLGLIPFVGAVVSVWLLRRQQRQALVWTMTVTTVAFLVPLTAWASAFWNDFKPVQPLVQHSGALRPDEEILIVGWQMEHLPSLNFYARRDITLVTSDRDIVPYLRYEMPVYVFMPVREWERLKPSLGGLCREVARHQDLYRRSQVVVVTNR